MDHPLLTAAQLGPQLKSLRKAKALTQAELGRRLNLGQGRIAQIEANPAVVSLEQLLQVLHALDARLHLRTAPDQQPRRGRRTEADW
ncbi:MAG TPA: helix-turn-helix domain-containing protein [Lautropia sp.]|jgi:HTH-type transcriptional regulator/antitoxin HipB|nr:helix-turn-helix domain-containing protein [Lautropia sp.]